MAHVRTQIRDAVIQRLKTLDALACVGPYGRTARSFQRDEIPAAIVRVSEVSTPVTKNRPRTIRRDMSVSIALLVGLTSDDVETALDDLAVDVEGVLADPAALGVGALLDWRLASSDPGAFELGEEFYGRLTVTYACSVSTAEGVPTTNIHA